MIDTHTIVKEVNDISFGKESTDGLVLVAFVAQWCSPCRMQLPILEKLATLLDGQLKICKLDVDNNRKTASQHQIQSVPALKLFRNGEIVRDFVGVQSLSFLEQEILNQINVASGK